MFIYTVYAFHNENAMECLEHKEQNWECFAYKKDLMEIPTGLE